MKRLALATLLLTTIGAGISIAPTGAAQRTRRYIVVSKSENAVSTEVLTQIQKARGQVRTNLSTMGLVAVTSDNPDFAKSVPAALVVAPDLRVNSPRPRVIEGPTLLDANAYRPGPPNTGSADFYLDLQWGVTAIDAQNAWSNGRRGKGVIVAVLDEGVDATHPDLKRNVRADLSTSFAQDCAGGIESWQPEPGFYFNHGTHVAGIIAADQNKYGVVGIASKAQIMAVDVLSRCLGYGLDSWIMDGIRYATDHGAKVINMSLGSGPISRNGACDDDGCYTAEDVKNLETAYRYAVRYARVRGVTVIASTGNDGFDFGTNKDFVHLPSDTNGIIAISATAPIGWAKDPSAANLDIPAYYSNWGRGHVTFAAPGGTDEYPGNENCTVAGLTRPCWVFDLVFSTIPGGWSWAAGTSMAAPHAAGVAAQYIAAGGGAIGPKEVEELLKTYADRPTVKAKLDAFYGYGRVDSTPRDR